MNDKKAIEILANLLKNPAFGEEEKEALRHAIGVLSWTKLAETRLDGLGEKRRKKWENN